MHLRPRSRAGPPARRRTAGLVLGLLLLAASSVLGLLAGRQQAVGQLDAALASSATEQVAVTDEYFERARSIVLLLAQNPVFSRHFGSRHSDGSGGDAHEGMNDALALVESLYPGRIGEACVIDWQGVEAARVVAGVAAPHSELSHEEAENAFFHRTRALTAGRVHQAPPYVSPDTGEWVISNSTPLPAGPAAVPGRADGSPGLVHFEISVDSFREQAERRGSRFPVLLVDGRTGDVVTATSRAQRRDEPLGSPSTALTRAVVAAGGPAGALTVDGTRAAYRRVAGGPDNANDWYVVTLSSELPGPWSTAGGRAAIGSAVGALLLLGSSLLSLRSGQRQLRRAAHTDPLTGLPNRALFTERLRERVRLVPGGHAEAVLLLDLDGFKEVNDTLGHLAGDRLLQQVATRIAGVLRPEDLVARLGGDEFAVHLPGVDDRVAAAAELAATLLEALRRPYVLDGVGIHVDGSVGIALAPQHGRTPEELLQHADVAMYQAKRDSAGFVVYDAASDPHSPERLQMVAGLLEAIESRRLDLHYQPQLDLASGRVAGVEALVRWRHPRLGLLPPAEFVPMAERTGLIRPLTRCVLELVIEQCAAWRAQGRELPVAVNCSALDVLDRRLPHEVGALLMHYDVPAHLLCLEITETSIMQEVERALEVLTGLHELGVRLAVDDFGTGYSSLAYLRQLPVGELKVDRGFVAGMADSQADRHIVRATVELGHKLGLSVVAEGVEDADTAQALHALGCDRAQGYHWSPPLPPAQLGEWLDGWATRAASRAGRERS